MAMLLLFFLYLWAQPAQLSTQQAIHEIFICWKSSDIIVGTGFKTNEEEWKLFCFIVAKLPPTVFICWLELLTTIAYYKSQWGVGEQWNKLSWNLNLVLIIVQQWKLMNSNIQSWLILTLSREFHINSFELITIHSVKNHTDRISY